MTKTISDMFEDVLAEEMNDAKLEITAEQFIETYNTEDKAQAYLEGHMATLEYLLTLLENGCSTKEAISAAVMSFGNIVAKVRKKTGWTL